MVHKSSKGINKANQIKAEPTIWYCHKNKIYCSDTNGKKTVLYQIKYLLEKRDELCNEQYKVTQTTLHHVKYLFVQHLT